MKLISAFCLLVLAALPLSAQSRPNPRVTGVSAAITSASPRVRSGVVETYGRLPLAFEANRGQTDPEVKFISRGAGYNLFLTSTKAVLTLRKGSRQEHTSPAKITEPLLDEKSAVLHMKLIGANSKADVFGQDELPGKSNYFIGNDPKNWHAGIAQYARVRYANVYPGVDLVYHGNQREMEYDFVLRPGADPGAIRLGIEGATKLRLLHGDLVLSSAGGDIHLRRPYTYQELHGTKQEIRGRYVLNGRNEVGFRVDSYNPRCALIIDPVLAYSTYLGGRYGDWGVDIKVDSTGSAYVTGITLSPDFPTVSASQSSYAGSLEGFVTKLNADGSKLVYSTYLGGSGDEYGFSIAVDSAGNSYVTGPTNSTDFPTVNAIQPTYGGGEHDAFVTKINADGSALVYSTYLGGNNWDWGYGIAVDSAGNAYVAGSTHSTNFPTANALQPNNYGKGEAFVSKINSAGSTFVYSTYLGGSSDDAAASIAVDKDGNAYLAGVTESTNFPTSHAVQPLYHGGVDAFLTKVNSQGSNLIYSTYLGGSGDEVPWRIAVDSASNAYVTGNTLSNDFPVVNAIQLTRRGGTDAFVTKINAAGSALAYSTYLGGTANDYGQGIAVDSAGSAYVIGTTSSADFPVANAIQPKYHSGTDALLAKINTDGGLVYSTYLGGTKAEEGLSVAVDSVGSAYLTGRTNSTNFSTTAAAFQSILNTPVNKQPDAFVVKVASETFVGLTPRKLIFAPATVGTTSIAQTLTLRNKGTSALTINKIYIAGLNAEDFAEVNTCRSTLAPKAQCTISVTFTPSAIGKRKAGVAISDSDHASPQATALTGTGQ